MTNNQKNNPPSILYGTAWKEEATQDLLLQALELGFIGIDTANQRKHYFEEAVGLAVQQFIKTSEKKRENLFIQTKFTSVNGQDHRLPYNPSDSLNKQVKQSFDSSLNHFQTDYIDSYVLHGPTFAQGIHEEDLEIWQSMEELFHEGKIKHLGVSNVNIRQIEELFEKVTVKPKFIQNRCFANTYWDKKIREFCAKNNIIYQGFSLLTANAPYLLNSTMQTIAEKYQKTIPQITFRFAVQMGMLPLSGTTNPQHMRDDLSIDDFELSTDELKKVETLANQ